MSKLQITDNTLYFECPHCNILIMVYTNEIGCKIFRCGIYKTTGEQIPPHTDKKTCDDLFNYNLIYGCGKPFLIENNKAIKCDYI